jgi:hypothetical protein
MNSTKYTRWYQGLMNKAVVRNTIDGYYEEHHILPKSLGGSDTKDNLVKLTAKEHYVAHLLLMKCFDEPVARQKMCAAYLYMSKVRNKHTARRYNSRLYEYHKSIRATILREQMTGKGNPMFGRVQSEETRRKISAAKLGVKIHTAETKAAKRRQFLENNPNNDPEVQRKQLEVKVKPYKIMNPEGVIFEGKNLAQFCREHKLNQGNLITYKKAKGWTLMDQV